MTLVKFFSSDRTKPNGQINDQYEEYSDWADKQPSSTITNVIDMNKQELMEYAKDMYGLNCKGMIASNIVKKIYEEANGKEITKRGRPKVINPEQAKASD